MPMFCDWAGLRCKSTCQVPGMSVSKKSFNSSLREGPSQTTTTSGARSLRTPDRCSRRVFTVVSVLCCASPWSGRTAGAPDPAVNRSFIHSTFQQSNLIVDIRAPPTASPIRKCDCGREDYGVTLTFTSAVVQQQTSPDPPSPEKSLALTLSTYSPGSLNIAVTVDLPRNGTFTPPPARTSFVGFSLSNMTAAGP